MYEGAVLNLISGGKSENKVLESYHAHLEKLSSEFLEKFKNSRDDLVYFAADLYGTTDSQLARPDLAEPFFFSIVSVDSPLEYPDYYEELLAKRAFKQEDYIKARSHVERALEVALLNSRPKDFLERIRRLKAEILLKSDGVR